MEWSLDKERPICPQLCEKICAAIATGGFEPHDRLMSVRDVAVQAGVNPNTVQKAFEMLEQESLIYSIRGSGWYVSNASDLAKEKLKTVVEEKVAGLVRDLAALGYPKDAVAEMVKECHYE